MSEPFDLNGMDAPPVVMHAFRCSKGHEWAVGVTIGDIPPQCVQFRLGEYVTKAVCIRCFEEMMLERCGIVEEVKR